MITKRWFFSIAIVLAVIAGCSKPNSDEQLSSGTGSSTGDPTVNTPTARAAILPDTKVPALTKFCEYKTYNFYAGQTIDVGDIIVGNTSDSLFIKLTVPNGFANTSENLKIWIGSTIFSSRPAAGQFPFKYDVATGTTVVNIGFSFAELGLKCDAAFYIVIHGDVPGETAFGGDISGPGNAWWYYISFTPKCCEQTECKISATAVVTDVKCYGSSTGAIDLTVKDGLAPFIYSWSNGATTEDLAGVPAGTYTVTVTDANKCSTTAANIVVAQPAAAISASSSVTNISAYGANDGAINVTVSGGTPAYAFLWSNGATTEDISGLAPGTYSVTITDANGCSTELKDILVEQPDKEKPKVLVAFARKTWEPMAHCFLGLDLDGNGTPDFNTWGWTNGALDETPGFTAQYELFMNANDCDITSATKVGDIFMTHEGGVAKVTFKLLPGYTMEKSSLYIGNEILPKDGGVYTIDPEKYPYQHDLSAATSDYYEVPVSGSIYLIGYIEITNPEVAR